MKRLDQHIARSTALSSRLVGLSGGADAMRRNVPSKLAVEGARDHVVLPLSYTVASANKGERMEAVEMRLPDGPQLDGLRALVAPRVRDHGEGADHGFGVFASAAGYLEAARGDYVRGDCGVDGEIFKILYFGLFHNFHGDAGDTC